MRGDFLRTKYLIIGAGLTGLSTAFHLKNNYILVEASDSPGGTANTLHYKGFKLDNAIHIFYFKNQSILEYIKETLQVELSETTRKSSVRINNRYINYPIQYHLSELCWSHRIKTMKSLLNFTLLKGITNTSDSFETYSLLAFGTHLTNIFIRPYNEKLFGVPIASLNTDWLGENIPYYSRIKMLFSTLGFANNSYGRNFKFFYPSEGGVATLAQKLSSQLRNRPLYNCKLETVFSAKKSALLSNGTEVNYEYLINTCPLNEFLNLVDPLPSEISGPLKLLKSNSTSLLHILGKGKIYREEHWIYVPDIAIPFHRITIPGNINPVNCPEGYFALTLEFGGNVIMDKAVLESSIDALKKMKILNNEMTEIEHKWKLIDCSYVIYDYNRNEVLKKIFSYLESKEIFSVGRYGAWEYSNMEDALLHGKKVAEKLSISN